MATLHSALQTLLPATFSEVPLEEPHLSTYLQDIFAKSQLLIDSVPPLAVDHTYTVPRSRATSSTSVASNLSEISTSSARSDPPPPEHALLQKEWGKPIKLSASDNPMGMAVYKMKGKDKRGSWFARRSVHEGLSFPRWKHALQSEFPESLKVQGGPGEGNVRGIGGEQRVEKKEIDGIGILEVYHLSAQFPGPTAPRDFVTLLLTSSSALHQAASRPSSSEMKDKTDSSQPTEISRHFMIISKPCRHPDCPPRAGFVRGEYESIEFIREIPVQHKKPLSTVDLSSSRQVTAQTSTAHQTATNGHLGLDSAKPISSTGSQRNNTTSIIESSGEEANEETEAQSERTEEEDETNPVEWIMITRSDPGGSVPRFMVESGTPAAIVADAGKFLDWACRRKIPITTQEAASERAEEPVIDSAEDDKKKSKGVHQTTDHLTSLDGVRDSDETATVPVLVPETEETPIIDLPSGLLQSVTNVACAGIETYAPQSIVDRLPIRNSTPTRPSVESQQEDHLINSPPRSLSEMSSATSVVSFASADSHLSSPDPSIKSTSLSATSLNKHPSSIHHDREMAKLTARKQKLDAKLLKTREKETRNKEELTSKEIERIRRAEEKHSREIAKAEERHSSQIAALEAKRVREEAKAEEKLKRAKDRDERARLIRERDEAREEVEVVKAERDILMARVGELQRENTGLVARLGKVDGGERVLAEVKEDGM